MEQLKNMKETLTSCVSAQIAGHMDTVEAGELGAAIDMIKDLSEAIYYCTITEAMEEDKEKDPRQGKNGHGMMYSTKTPMYHYPMPIEYYDPRYRETYEYPMYAQNTSGRGGNSGGYNTSSRGGNTRGYQEGMIPMGYDQPRYNDGMMYNDGYYPVMKDPREGRSGMRRKMYMEGKGMHDKNKQMQELESYMQELTYDLTEMIADASPEEKQMLQQKINTLATKIK